MMLMRDATGIYGFGSLDVLNPQTYGLPYELEAYNNWYADYIEQYKPLLDNHGVTDIRLFIEIFDDGGQLNLEVFSREMLQRLAPHNVAIPLSVYGVETAQLVEWLTEAGVNQETIDQHMLWG